MIVLAPGTPKYLLIDHLEHARNAERVSRQAPVGVVAERQEHGIRHYVGYGVHALGGVRLVAQRDPLFTFRLQPHYPDEKIRVAYCTEGEVRIAETPDEDLTAAPESKPAAPSTTSTNPAKAKPTIKKEPS